MVPRLYNEEVYSIFTHRLKLQHTVAIVTASLDIWINPWCEINGSQCISTITHKSNGVITGRLIGKNCYGKRKVKMIKERYQLEKFDTIYAYGKDESDFAMLEIADKAFLVSQGKLTQWQKPHYSSS